MRGRTPRPRTTVSLNAVFLAGFALLARFDVGAVLCMLGIGLVGVTMNPALVTRVQRVGNARPLVNTVHSSFITFGVVLGSALGGLGLDRFGLRAPLWLGAALAVTGLLTLVPDLLRRTQRLTRPRTASDGTDTTSLANSEHRTPTPLHPG
ncbi:MFS transporter OS=Streptomyces microflavus OX=1919 GN=Smic_61540 PE=4 SV=1 [Streptomyces microflavus]